MINCAESSGIACRGEAAAARREAGVARSSVTQVITKSSTLQRMMKSRKQRKTLRKADTVA